jgi:hypothetical protein
MSEFRFIGRVACLPDGVIHDVYEDALGRQWVAQHGVRVCGPWLPRAANQPPRAGASEDGGGWFIRTGVEEFGPFTIEELTAKAAAGLLGPEDLVREADCEWARVQDHAILGNLMGDLMQAPSQKAADTGSRAGWALMRARRVISSLTPKQKRILWAGVGCLAVLGLYVPWKHTWGASQSAPAGYHLIFWPPAAEGRGLKVDTTRLLIPMAVVACVTAAAVVLASGRVPMAGPPPRPWAKQVVTVLSSWWGDLRPLQAARQAAEPLSPGGVATSGALSRGLRRALGGR